MFFFRCFLIIFFIKNTPLLCEWYDVKYVNNNKQNIIFVYKNPPRSNWKWNHKKKNYLVDLVFSNHKINDLKGIEQFEYLERLDLSYNPISSIESISKLKYLKVLDLSHTKVSDPHPLNNQSSLEILFIYKSKIKNLDNLYIDLKKIYLSKGVDVVKYKLKHPQTKIVNELNVSEEEKHIFN